MNRSTLSSLLVIAGLLGMAPAQGQDTIPRSKKLGNLLIEVADVSTPAYGPGLPSPGLNRRRPPPADHYFVSIAVNVLNVGKKQAICARFKATLTAEYGLEATDFLQAEAPRVAQLLPGEAVRGRFMFTVKRGARPLVLTVEPQEYSEGCRERAGVRLTLSSWATRAQFSISGVESPKE